MEKKINHAMVGVFVIALGATWLAISLWLALGDFATPYATYRVNMDGQVLEQARSTQKYHNKIPDDQEN